MLECRLVSVSRAKLITVLIVMYVAVFYTSIPCHTFLDRESSNKKGGAPVRLSNKSGLRVQTAQYKWPPEDLSRIRVHATGLFDLTLRPWVVPDTRKPRDTYYDILKSLYEGKNITGSEIHKLVIMDQAVRMGGSNPNYYLYPQFMDLDEAVKSIKLGLPVNEHPINNPVLLVVEPPKLTCTFTGQNEGRTRETYPLDLVILVKSCLDCSGRRKHLRSTYMQPHIWGSFRVQHAFVVGLPFIEDSERLYFDGVDFPVNRKIVNRTQLKKARLNLFKESTDHNDMLVGNFRDTYFNLTLKQMFTFRWASAFCKDQTPLFLFIDDDVSVNPKNLIKFIGRIPLQTRPRLTGGRRPASYVPIRPAKSGGSHVWAVSEDEFPWSLYPTYALGASYMVGAEYACDAAIAMAFTRYIRIEDLFLGIIWAKLKHAVLNFPGFRMKISSLKEVNDTLTAFTYSMDQYMNWETGEAKQSNYSKPALGNI